MIKNLSQLKKSLKKGEVFLFEENKEVLEKEKVK